jgi:hypothetical protein
VNDPDRAIPPRLARIRAEQPASDGRGPQPPARAPTAEEQRIQRLQMQEDAIGRALAESERNGELRSAPSYGKPLALGDGYMDTPAELRMPMKILKDAGVWPPEVQAMRDIAAMQDRLQSLPDGEEARDLRRRITDARQALALRLEKLAATRSL